MSRVGNKRADNRTDRPKRVPINGMERNILSVDGCDPEYVYRWVLDVSEDGTRIERFKSASYEFAPSDGLTVGDQAVYQSKSKGSVVRAPAGRDGNYQYLMRIPKEFYDEDLEAKAAAVDATEQQMKRPSEDGQYGKYDGEAFKTSRNLS